MLLHVHIRIWYLQKQTQHQQQPRHLEFSELGKCKTISDRRQQQKTFIIEKGHFFLIHTPANVIWRSKSLLNMAGNSNAWRRRSKLKVALHKSALKLQNQSFAHIHTQGIACSSYVSMSRLVEIWNNVSSFLARPIFFLKKTIEDILRRSSFYYSEFLCIVRAWKTQKKACTHPFTAVISPKH